MGSEYYWVRVIDLGYTPKCGVLPINGDSGYPENDLLCGKFRFSNGYFLQLAVF